MARTNCLACGKINSDGRERCMYCESYLAGSMPAPPEVPEYLRRKPRRFPWLWILAILGAAGGAVYMAHRAGVLRLPWP